MKLLLVMCSICDGWFSPSAHKHCPYCAALKVAGLGTINAHNGLPIMRAIKRPVEKIIAFRGEQ